MKVRSLAKYVLGSMRATVRAASFLGLGAAGLRRPVHPTPPAGPRGDLSPLALGGSSSASMRTATAPERKQPSSERHPASS
jgi:hypothetical protein